MAAMIIGVCKKTLRRWEKKDRIASLRCYCGAKRNIS